MVRERDAASGAAVSSHQVGEQRQADGFFGAFGSPLAIGPDAHTLLVQWSNSVVGLWDLTSHRIVSLLGRVNVYRARFSPDGQRLATDDGSMTGVSSVWEVKSGSRIALLRQERGVKAAAFSPDGRTGDRHCGGGRRRPSVRCRFRPRAAAARGSPERGLGRVESGWAERRHGGVRRAPLAGDAARPALVVRLRSGAVAAVAVQRERFGVTDEWCTPEVSEALREHQEGRVRTSTSLTRAWLSYLPRPAVQFIQNHDGRRRALVPTFRPVKSPGQRCRNLAAGFDILLTAATRG